MIERYSGEHYEWRRRAMLYYALPASWITALTLGAGILFLGWPPWLIFASPFVLLLLFVAADEWVCSNVRVRRRRERAERRKARHRAARAHR